jgi:hypothetical protein
MIGDMKTPDNITLTTSPRGSCAVAQLGYNVDYFGNSVRFVKGTSADGLGLDYGGIMTPRAGFTEFLGSNVGLRNRYDAASKILAVECNVQCLSDSGDLFRGKFSDMYFISRIVPIGTPLPAAASPSFTVLGDFAIPCLVVPLI